MRRILLAEGHGPTREFLCRRLGDAGFHVVVAENPAHAYETYASQRPLAVILAADFAGAAAALADRLREADPRVLLVVTDREHLGKGRGLDAVLPMKPNAYVPDPTGKELVEKVRHILRQSAAGEGPRRGTALVLDRAPAMWGDLELGSVARVLHQVWRGLSDGILVLEEGGVERRLYVLRGLPVAWESSDAQEGLLGWLASEGRLDEARRAVALDGMASGLTAGAALIAAGVLEPGEPLMEALHAHLKAMVLRSVAAKNGRWRFHAGGDFSSEVHAVRMRPLQAVLEGARAALPAKHFADGLRGVMDAYPARTEGFQQLLPACGLGSQDLRLALSLDGSETTRAWLDARDRELQPALSLLWFLVLVEGVTFSETPTGADVYGKAAPRRRRPLPPGRAEAIRQAALQILPGTYFQALGVDIAAGAEEVSRAYAEVASRFHPDAFAEYDAGDLEDLLSAVQDKVAAAHRVLASDEKRRAYLAFLVGKVEALGIRRPGIDLDAEIAFRKGERALVDRRHAEAIRTLREAASRNPKEPEYHAMLAFAELFDPSRPPKARAQTVKRVARKALALAPDHPRATVALALAAESLGEIAEARRAVLSGLKRHPASFLLREVLHRLNRPRA